MMTFNSLTNKHKIIVEIMDYSALINTMEITFEEPVELSILLTDMCKKLKENNIKLVIQQVDENDWYNILKPLGYFEFVNQNEEFKYINVSVLIDVFPIAVMTSLGYKQ